MSDTNRVALRVVEESALNTFPGGSLQTLRITGESLNTNVETIESAELRSDRSISDLIKVDQSNGGGFNFELSFGSFDTLLEGALFADWSTNVLTNGATRHSYSIEKALLDIDEYFLFTGMVVSRFNLNLASKAIATGSFEFLGCGSVLGQSANSATIATATTSSVMNCGTNVTSLLESSYGGTLSALTGIYVQELSVSIDNALRPIAGIGYNSIQNIGVGAMKITGSMNAYFASDRLYDKFLANTAFAMQFIISDGTNSYTVLIPKAKFASNQVVAGSKDQDVMENLTWQALYDATTNCMIRITRSA